MHIVDAHVHLTESLGTFQFHLNSNKMLKKSFDKIEDFLISWLIETLMFS